MKEGWEYKKLGEVCEIFDKQRKPVTKSARTNGVYPYYGATGIQDYVADYIFDGRFVLIGEDGAKWGACENTAFIIEGKSWVNNHAHIIKFDSNIIDSFAVYFLNFSNLDSFISGAVVRKLTQASMKDIVLPLPPLSEQQAIVAELDKINEIIDLKKAQLKDLDLLAQSIFYDMFGDPIENPKGWEVKKLGEVCEKITDGTHNSPENFTEGEYMYVTAKNIKQDGIQTSDITYVSKEVHQVIYERCNPEFGDILYIKDGATTGIATINTLRNEFSLLSSVALIKPCKILVNYYLKYLLNNKAMYSSIRTSMGGAAITRLTLVKIKNIKLPLPPLSLQQSFASKIQAIESQKSAIKQSLAEVETLLASRMDYYFTNTTPV